MELMIIIVQEQDYPKLSSTFIHNRVMATKFSTEGLYLNKLYRTYFRLSVRRIGCSKTGVGELGKVPDQVPGSPGCICFPGSGPWRCHRTVIMLQFNCNVIIAITKA